VTDKHNKVIGIVTRADLVASHVMSQSRTSDSHAPAKVSVPDAGLDFEDNATL